MATAEATITLWLSDCIRCLPEVNMPSCCAASYVTVACDLQLSRQMAARPSRKGVVKKKDFSFSLPPGQD